MSSSCEQDLYLMDEFHNLGLYNKQQLFGLNAIRMYLQVTTQSNVVDGRGKCVTVEAYNGKKQMDQLIFYTEVAMSTRHHYKTTESMESWMTFEAATRKVNCNLDPSVVIIL